MIPTSHFITAVSQICHSPDFTSAPGLCSRAQSWLLAATQPWLRPEGRRLLCGRLPAIHLMQESYGIGEDRALRDSIAVVFQLLHASDFACVPLGKCMLSPPSKRLRTLKFLHMPTLNTRFKVCSRVESDISRFRAVVFQFVHRPESAVASASMRFYWIRTRNGSALRNVATRISFPCVMSLR